jgi:hypothetical protein
LDHTQIGKALLIIRPNAQWSLTGDDFDNLEWLDDKQTKPTFEEVKAEIDNPTPTPEPTVEQKLASVGLNLADLKTALGL